MQHFVNKQHSHNEFAISPTEPNNRQICGGVELRGPAVDRTKPGLQLLVD